MSAKNFVDTSFALEVSACVSGKKSPAVWFAVNPNCSSLQNSLLIALFSVHNTEKTVL